MVGTIDVPDSEFEQFRDGTDATAAPSVSFIVPVYDDPEGISDTLESIQRTSYPNLEVMVVMTPADGETEAVVEEFVASDDRIAVYVEDEYQTPGAARNVGLEHAEGDLIVFIDADMTAEATLPWKVAYAFETHAVDYLGFPVELVPAENETIFGWYDRRVRFRNELLMEEADFCPTCALAIRREVYEAGHEFNPRLTSAEDVCFGDHVAADGFEFGFCPDISVDHPSRNSLRALLARAKKVGIGWHEVYKQEPEEEAYERSPVLMYVSFVPDPPSILGKWARDWESLGTHQKVAVTAINYAENLAQTFGYAVEAIESDGTIER